MASLNSGRLLKSGNISCYAFHDTFSMSFSCPEILTAGRRDHQSSHKRLSLVDVAANSSCVTKQNAMHGIGVVVSSFFGNPNGRTTELHLFL